ncbi:MAG: hypothetical protein IT365_11290 [Candidatus Hydrogenedentes bacterium]|nr:hypothetical protein [Candidatus Hydrogenedentota bacterium]
MDIPQVSLPAALQAIQQRWLQLHRKEQDELYAQEFAAPFARLFAELPLFGASPSLPKPRALVSVLGFSWQPVALMAAWCRPEQILLLGTEDSLRQMVAGEDIQSIIARVADIDRDIIDKRRIGDPGETDIYRAVRDFLSTGISPREAFIDPTGGKKSMSASAALAGFVAGAALVYVDYKEYHGSNRIPVAGTEYPRLLANPLEVFGDLELRDVFVAFNRSDFDEAERLARKLSKRLYEPREAEALAELAAGYAAWDRFTFCDARKRLSEADRLITGFASMGKWGWATDVRETLTANLQALETLEKINRTPASLDEGLPLVIWYLAAAQRMAGAEKFSLAVLLLYAAMERFMGLCLRIEYGLDDEQPDYALIQDQIDQKSFDDAGKKLVGKGYQRRELAGPLMFTNSAQLLATLDPALLKPRDLGPMCGLATTRNKCEYEHGFLPRVPTRDNVEKSLESVKSIVMRRCQEIPLETRLASYRFPTLAGTQEP